jgi:hypothetical protein
MTLKIIRKHLAALVQIPQLEIQAPQVQEVVQVLLR